MLFAKFACPNTCTHDHYATSMLSRFFKEREFDKNLKIFYAKVQFMLLFQIYSEEYVTKGKKIF